MSNIVHFKGQLHRNAFPCIHEYQKAYAYFEIRPASNAYLPLNLSLVLDNSSSRHGEKVGCLKQAVKSLIGQLRPNDCISVVIFNSHTELLVEAINGHNPEAMQRRIDNLGVGSDSTDNNSRRMAPAMRTGLDNISRYMGPNKVSRLIILTDGQTVDEDDCRHQADEAGKMGIPIIAIGLGTDWNEELLMGIAQRSGPLGGARLIGRPEYIGATFQNVLKEMMVVAKRLSFHLQVTPGVEIRDIWQAAPFVVPLIETHPVQESTVIIELPELPGKGVAYLIEMLIPPHQPGSYLLAQGILQYDVPTQGLDHQRESVDVIAEITANATQLNQVNGRVLNIVEKVTAWSFSKGEAVYLSDQAFHSDTQVNESENKMQAYPTNGELNDYEREAEACLKLAINAIQTRQEELYFAAAQAFVRAAKQYELEQKRQKPELADLWEKAFAHYRKALEEEQANACQQEIIRLREWPDLQVTITAAKELVLDQYDDLFIQLKNVGYGTASMVFIRVVDSSFEGPDFATQQIDGLKRNRERSFNLRVMPKKAGSAVPLTLEISYQLPNDEPRTRRVDGRVPVKSSDSQHITPHDSWYGRTPSGGVAQVINIYGDNIAAGGQKGDKVEINRGDNRGLHLTADEMRRDNQDNATVCAGGEHDFDGSRFCRHCGVSRDNA